MNAKQMVEVMRTFPAGDVRARFYILASKIYDARLKSGERLTDAIDFKAWLCEIGDEYARTEASKPAERSTGPKVIPRLGMELQQERTCPRCGHVHQGEYECETDMGATAGKCACRYRMEVTA